MNRSTVVITGLLILAAAIFLFPRQTENKATNSNLPAEATEAMENNVSGIDVAAPAIAPALAPPQPDSLQQQIGIRLAGNPADETLNGLASQLDRYEELSETEKVNLLTAYATFFMRNSQYGDARFFYEQILHLPNLDQTNRHAILQMLARIAIAAEDWNGFLAYNDQYFSEGGLYNWIVTGNLLNAYQRLGNFDAAGQALLLHLETGLNPNFDVSDQQYQRYYETAQEIPLRVSNPEDALEIAQGMVNQFDRPENWKVLAEVYQRSGDQTNLNSVMDTARARGFVDSSDNWLMSDSSQ